MIDDAALGAMAEALARIDGIEAVVLGGSRARGSHRPDSDLDLGLYYDHRRIDVDALRSLARSTTGLDVTVAGPGGWGPWVDGGAWLDVGGTAVDWILRDVARVRRQRDRAVRGEFAFHHQAGHPLGFLDVSYVGEAVLCRPLIDPRGVIADLRSGVVPYPERLRASMIANLWQAGFLLDAAGKAAVRGDIAYVALCCSTAAMVCAHAWHAAAGVWVINEKDLVPGVGRLDLDAGTFLDDVRGALSGLDADEASLRSAIAGMRVAVDLTAERLARRSPRFARPAWMGPGTASSMQDVDTSGSAGPGVVNGPISGEDGA